MNNFKEKNYFLHYYLYDIPHSDPHQTQWLYGADQCAMPSKY